MVKNATKRADPSAIPAETFLLNWLLKHENLFRLSTRESRSLFRLAKPIGEVSILLKVLNTPVPKVRHFAERIWVSLADLPITPWWAAFKESLIHQPGHVEILQLFFHLSTICNRRFPYHEQLLDLVGQSYNKDHSPTSARAYVYELAGIGNATPVAQRELREQLDDYSICDQVGSSQGYNLTHTVFYGTSFGKKELITSRGGSDVTAYLDECLTSAIRHQNLDLSAELIAAANFLKLGPSQVIDHAHSLVIRNVSFDDAAPFLRENKFCTKNNYQLRYYHLAITTLLAITASKK